MQTIVEKCKLCEAVKKGHCITKRFIRDEEIMHQCISVGHCHCAMFMIEHGCPVGNACNIAARCGFHMCMVMASSLCGIMNEETCENAALGGNIDCLRYARAYNCPWDEKITTIAIKNGHYDMLKYAVEEGCPISNDSGLWRHIIETEKMEFMLSLKHEKLPSDICDIVAGIDYHTLKNVHEKGFRFSRRAYINAVMNNNVDCFRYLHLNGCPGYDEDISVTAGFYGRDCLNYIKKNKLPLHFSLWGKNGYTGD